MGRLGQNYLDKVYVLSYQELKVRAGIFGDYPIDKSLALK